jgi:hypothetical protein
VPHSLPQLLEVLNNQTILEVFQFIIAQFIQILHGVCYTFSIEIHPVTLKLALTGQQILLQLDAYKFYSA